MRVDPIVEEVRHVRREILEEFDNDLSKFREYLEKQREEYKDRLVSRQTISSEELRRRIKEKFPDVRIGKD